MRGLRQNKLTSKRAKILLLIFCNFAFSCRSSPFIKSARFRHGENAQPVFSMLLLNIGGQVLYFDLGISFSNRLTVE